MQLIQEIYDARFAAESGEFRCELKNLQHTADTSTPAVAAAQTAGGDGNGADVVGRPAAGGRENTAGFVLFPGHCVGRVRRAVVHD